MSDENKLRDAADAVKALAETVPIYQDVAQPAAKEIGTALQTIARTIHVALAPLSALVWGYDKIKDYLNETLTEKLKDTPQERIVTPNPTVAGPAIEALRFSAHEPTLRELYANLLATSMDSKTAHEAHPAFVEILRQLTPDEARIVEFISSVRYTPFPIPLISVRVSAETLDGKGQHFEDFRHFSVIGQVAKCSHPELTLTYLDNLLRLGLIEILPYELSLYAKLDCSSIFEALEQHPRIRYEWAPKLEEPLKLFPPEIRREILRLTELGIKFCAACVINQTSA